jgi:hypothetical protein
MPFKTDSLKSKEINYIKNKERQLYKTNNDNKEILGKPVHFFVDLMLFII